MHNKCALSFIAFKKKYKNEKEWLSYHHSIAHLLYIEHILKHHTVKGQYSREQQAKSS